MILAPGFLRHGPTPLRSASASRSGSPGLCVPLQGDDHRTRRMAASLTRAASMTRRRTAPFNGAMSRLKSATYTVDRATRYSQSIPALHRSISTMLEPSSGVVRGALIEGVPDGVDERFDHPASVRNLVGREVVGYDDVARAEAGTSICSTYAVKTSVSLGPSTTIGTWGFADLGVEGNPEGRVYNIQFSRRPHRDARDVVLLQGVGFRRSSSVILPSMDLHWAGQRVKVRRT